MTDAAVRFTDKSSHRVSCPLPIHIVIVVVVTEPNCILLGVFKLTNNSFISPGAKFREKTSVPVSSCNVGVPPHEGAVQSIEVVLS